MTLALDRPPASGPGTGPSGTDPDGTGPNGTGRRGGEGDDRRRRRRRALVWVGIGVVLVVAIVVALVSSGSTARIELGAEDPSPIGSKALVQVLRDQGVDVRVTASLAATRRAVQDAGAERTTVLAYDEQGILQTAQWRRLGASGARLVVVQPYVETLDALAPEVTPRGGGSGTASGCRLGGLRPADRVTATGERYAMTPGPGAADARVCLGSASRGYALVRTGSPSGAEVAIVGNAEAFQNGRVLDRANGAYALGLLGERATLVWYLPGDADLPRGPGDVPLVPPWYAPTMGLLVLVALAGILWRGRRFGPLAIENLPVIVPAAETMEGRARLYARSSARLRALDALRIGAIQRIARDCGRPRVATVQEIVDAAAAATGLPRAEVARTVLDAVPSGDADLMRLSAAHADLERRVHAATRGR
ncbi:MAG: DUF4350 domain-containing protein [Micrococcales bacterium]|nr:DUF4350 domain-containing protein [Micrococcales bacterium]